MGPIHIVVCLSAVWCANAARLRRSYAAKIRRNYKKFEETYPGTPIQPVEQYGRFPYPAKSLEREDKQVNIIEPDMINNAVRTAPKDGVKAGPSVRAGDGWVTFRQGEGAYNSTGAYDLKCCVVCTPDTNCNKIRCQSACKKFCGPACVVPSKAGDNTIVHHMVKGYENLHSVAVAKQILIPNPAWARAALGPIPISEPATNGPPIIPVDEEPREKKVEKKEEPREKEPEEEEKPKEKEVEKEKPKEKEVEKEEKPKEKEVEKEKPKEKEVEKEEKPKEKEVEKEKPKEKEVEKEEKPKEKEVEKEEKPKDKGEKKKEENPERLA